jgi:hypothetical protein
MMILFDLRLRDCEPVVGRDVNQVERGGWTGLREWQPSVVLFVDKNVWLVWFLFCVVKEKRRLGKQATVNQ